MFWGNEAIKNLPKRYKNALKYYVTVRSEENTTKFENLLYNQCVKYPIDHEFWGTMFNSLEDKNHCKRILKAINHKNPGKLIVELNEIDKFIDTTKLTDPNHEF